MMNLTVVPSLPPSHSNTAELLALLSDPKAAAKRLADLKMAHAGATAAFDEAKKLRDEVLAQRQAHTADVNTFAADRAAHEEYLKASAGKLDEREAALVRKEQELMTHIASREGALAEAIAAHDARAAAFLDKVKALQAEARALLPV